MANILDGKIVIVTGASSGIGEATARLLSSEGAKVALVARRKDRIDNLEKELKATGGEALAIEADITDKKKCADVIKNVMGKWGKIDILVNNAGVMLLGPALDAPIKGWEQMIQVNVLGLLYMTHAALPVIKQNKNGHIVNISSVAGRTTRSGSAVYNATKWGVVAFTDALRQELAEQKTGVRTTLIEPGYVKTELQSHNSPKIQKELKERFKDAKGLEAEDIANGIYYAVSQPNHVSVNEILIRPTAQVG
jgi:NADP-dependent 3-hydroxy acid dehydrogenase YdfG